MSYKLGLNVEGLTLTGGLDISGTGNSVENIIVGNGGASTIKGGEGHDVLSGGNVADRFLFDTTVSATNRDGILDFCASDDTTALARAIFTRMTGNGAPPPARLLQERQPRMQGIESFTTRRPETSSMIVMARGRQPRACSCMWMREPCSRTQTSL